MVGRDTLERPSSGLAGGEAGLQSPWDEDERPRVHRGAVQHHPVHGPGHHDLPSTVQETEMPSSQPLYGDQLGGVLGRPPIANRTEDGGRRAFRIPTKEASTAIGHPTVGAHETAVPDGAKPGHSHGDSHVDRGLLPHHNSHGQEGEAASAPRI